MKLHVTIPSSDFLAEFPNARRDDVLRLLRSDMNDYVDEADRLLGRQPAARGLRAARDRGADSAMRADSLDVEIELRAGRVTIAGIWLSGLEDLERALERIALRTFARPARDLHHTGEHAAAPAGATEGSASHGPGHPEP